MDTLPNFLRACSARSPALHAPDAFLPAFLQSFFLTTVCEFGDRTFFVAALMATTAPRFHVWAGVLAAVSLITALSAALGRAFPYLVTDLHMAVAAALLFLFFGQQQLRGWWRMGSSGAGAEFASAEGDLKKEKDQCSSLSFLPPAFVRAFSLTLLAEWGDRSQVATIAIAASSNVAGVVSGVVAGHAICTAAAVVGGRILAGRISERAVTLVSGLLFIAFSVFTAAGIGRFLPPQHATDVNTL